VCVDFRVVDGEEHLLDAAHVGRAVVGEAACDVGTSGIAAGEVLVRATRSVDAAAVGDIVDCVVDGEVEWLLGVAAVVRSELLGSEIERPLLSSSASVTLDHTGGEPTSNAQRLTS
jgi:hypothetical protein